jgi:hypothetical protein
VIIISVIVSSDFRGNQGIDNFIEIMQRRSCVTINITEVSLNSQTELRDHHHHHHHHAHDFFVIGFWGRATSPVTGRLKHPSQSADVLFQGEVLPARDKKALKGLKGPFRGRCLRRLGRCLRPMDGVSMNCQGAQGRASLRPPAMLYHLMAS